MIAGRKRIVYIMLFVLMLTFFFRMPVLDYSYDKNKQISINTVDTNVDYVEMKLIQNYNALIEHFSVRCSQSHTYIRNTLSLLFVFLFFSVIYFLSRNYLIIHDDRHIVFFRYFIFYMHNKDGRKRAGYYLVKNYYIFRRLVYEWLRYFCYVFMYNCGDSDDILRYC